MRDAKRLREFGYRMDELQSGLEADMERIGLPFKEATHGGNNTDGSVAGYQTADIHVVYRWFRLWCQDVAKRLKLIGPEIYDDPDNPYLKTLTPEQREIYKRGCQDTAGEFLEGRDEFIRGIRAWLQSHGYPEIWDAMQKETK